MALIKTLKDFLTKTVIYPTTKTNAVYDDTVGRLDTYLAKTLGAEPIDDVEEETAELRDADTLGGRYTAEDLDAMPKSSAIEDYANVEPPIVDADYLGGKKASEYATKENLGKSVIVKTYTRHLSLRANEYVELRVTAPTVDGYKCIASAYCNEVGARTTEPYIFFSDYSEGNNNNNLAVKNLLSTSSQSDHKMVFIYTLDS